MVCGVSSSGSDKCFTEEETDVPPPLLSDSEDDADIDLPRPRDDEDDGDGDATGDHSNVRRSDHHRNLTLLCNITQQSVT